jgi:hypothetical protein
LATSPQLPDEFEELEFDIVKEFWNEYDVEDNHINSHIKARSILRKIYRDPHSRDQYIFDLNPPIVTIYSPVAGRGEKNNAPTPEQYDTLPSYEVTIQRNDEKWNRYRILKTGQEIKTRLIANEIRRITDRYYNDGSPFYLVYFGSPSIIVGQPQDNLRP